MNFSLNSKLVCNPFGVFQHAGQEVRTIVAQTVQANCTPLLAQPMERSVDWDWLPEYHPVQDTYGRQATRRSM